MAGAVFVGAGVLAQNGVPHSERTREAPGRGDGNVFAQYVARGHQAGRERVCRARRHDPARGGELVARDEQGVELFDGELALLLRGERRDGLRVGEVCGSMIFLEGPRRVVFFWWLVARDKQGVELFDGELALLLGGRRRDGLWFCFWGWLGAGCGAPSVARSRRV